jgi:hypothetical protein
MSSDVDLFTTASAEAHFASAVDAVIAASARYTGEELLRLAEDHDPGFDGLLFADALAAIDRLPDVLFQPYGLNSRDVDALKIRMNEWAGRIRTGRRG